MSSAVHPSAALAHWQLLEKARSDDPAERVSQWLLRLHARMIATGGRLSRRLVESGLCDVEVLRRCVHAQLDAGPADARMLFYDVEADLDLVVELGSIETALELSEKIATLTWARDELAGVQTDVATRLLAANRESEIELVFERIAWHGHLTSWLEKNQESLSQDARTRLLARAARLAEEENLPVPTRIGVFATLATLTKDRTWIDRARVMLATLSREEIENSGETSPPEETLAIAIAELGAFDEALANTETLNPEERWNARVNLISYAPTPTRRAALVDELAATATLLERPWWKLLQEAPELGPRALLEIEKIADEEALLPLLGFVAEYVDQEHKKEIAKRLLKHAIALDPRSPIFTNTWQNTLETLASTKQESLFEEIVRRALIDELLADPKKDLWPEAARFVPEDRALAVLVFSKSNLEVATHYSDRDKWIEVGLELLAKAPGHAKEWLQVAARQMAKTGIEGTHEKRLAAWPLEEQQSIILARLAHHQNEFLPHWLFEPLQKAARDLSILSADLVDSAEARRELFGLTNNTAWPTSETFTRLLTLLRQCAGEAALAEPLALLTKLAAPLTPKTP